MPAPPKRARKPLTYRDEKGNILYGFSQENLERTNREIRRTTRYLQLLVVLVIILLGVMVATIVWADLNNVITAMIYR